MSCYQPPVTPGKCVPLASEPHCFAEQVAALGGKSYPLDLGRRAYNPGLAPIVSSIKGETFWAVMREQEVDVTRKIVPSRLVMVGLSADFKVLWEKEIKGLPPVPHQGIQMQEDGRLFWFYGKLMLAWTNAVFLPGREHTTFKQALCALKYNGKDFVAYDVKQLNFGHNRHDSPNPEKNWQFFNDGGLRFVYSLHPHIVVEPSTGKVHSTDSREARWWTQAWGEMHGGTPPVELDDGTFLSFFHSYVGHSRFQRRYAVGAYVFGGPDNHYRMQRITSAPLFIASEKEGKLWQSPIFWEPLVTFVSGCILDNDDLIITAGTNDCHAHAARIPLSSVLSRMTPTT